MDHRTILEQIWQVYSGDAAWQTVSDLSRFHRIQASPGYRQAAQWIYKTLLREGLAADIISYPADLETSFWTWPSFQEWACTGATLDLLSPGRPAERLADYRACPISLIQRSTAFDGEAEVVLLSDGLQEADYEGLELAGKVVFTRGNVNRVRELAVEQYGAIGILFDGMRPVPPVRREGDLADVRQYTSFWYEAGDATCFGFALTPRQGQALRHALARAEEPVRIRARVNSRLYDGAMEVVTATIPGEKDREVLVVAHLCHPSPSANDNASGAAAALEAARALKHVVDEGRNPRPEATVRFVWLPEMNGALAYLASREDELPKIVAGINLDMVGEDQRQTGSVWLIERPPDAAASFAPDLLARLRDELPSLKGMPDVSPSHTGVGAYPLYRQAEVPFSGGSDHVALSDPTVGVPTPMLIQWPDRFYHTSADTPDRTDPNSLARSGTLAAAYAYWLATAGTGEATWLGYEMVARFKEKVVQAARKAVDRALALEDTEALARELASLDRRLAYLLAREKAALMTLERLGPIQCLMTDLIPEVERSVHHELAWARGAVELKAVSLGAGTLPDVPSADLSELEMEAAGLTPVRQVRGPIPLQQHLKRLSAEDRATVKKLLEDRQEHAAHTLLTLALYWADGVHTVLDIVNLVELEAGFRDVELVLTYFRMLKNLGFVQL
jgi:hypothetical protein